MIPTDEPPRLSFVVWAGASTPVSTAAGTRGPEAMLKKFARLASHGD